MRRDAVAIGPRLRHLALRIDWADWRGRPVEVPDQQTEHGGQQEGEDRKTARPRRDPAADRLLLGPDEKRVSGGQPAQDQSQAYERHEQHLPVRSGHVALVLEDPHPAADDVREARHRDQ